MRVGLNDVDGHNYPNIALMKISAYHKSIGDEVEWYDALFGGWYDKVYMSKVFGFSQDYQYPINATEIEQGGTGYCIDYVNGKEIYHKERDNQLPNEIEHIYPDYSLYPNMTKNTAYGFMSRGCPRGCNFCIVKDKEGLCSTKVADLKEFWNGQKYIELLDPNTLACKEWKDILKQLIDSKAVVNFNQGLDIRMMTEEKAMMLSNIQTNMIHFAWDRYEDKEMILPKFEMFRKASKVNERNLSVYVLTNYDTTIEQDLERIYTLRDMGYTPYVMIYDKEHLPRNAEIKRVQRWCNNRFIFRSCLNYEDYKQ